MDSILSVLATIAIIFGVVMLFNFMIFIHELGHFFAARWRGLYVDRFQIWFGRPIWKKTVNGVQWGLGWIPAGGFVSLPQMAPMEAIEGRAELPKDLKPVTPLDKIIRGRRRACRFFSAGCVVCRGRLDGGQAGCGDGRDYGRFCCSGQPCGSGRHSSRRQDCESGRPVLWTSGRAIWKACGN